jgi:hypothetical protein
MNEKTNSCGIGSAALRSSETATLFISQVSATISQASLFEAGRSFLLEKERWS